MLLLHQTGSVKIGEVVRYTVTYTPSQDRILPSPEFLYLRVKNSSAIALRAAFVHGPYNLSVAAYPATYNPNKKFEDARLYGVPEFEPMLKAGGTWTCHLVVPETIRESAGIGRADKQHFGNGPEHKDESVSWVIEIASQVIFSTSAAVHYDFLLARDEKSLGLPSSGISVVGSQAQVPQPGRVSDFQQSKGAKDGHHAAQSKGVFSRALHLNVEDTASLWNTPRFPGLEQSTKNADAAGGPDTQAVQSAKPPKDAKVEESKPKRKKHVHLVILTHGLHSNLGSDMLYLKESIDAAAKQARVDARARRRKERDSQTHESEATATGGMSDDTTDNEDDDDEETIVRGFSGNATRTERGIKYLGKRLARYVLSTTYPDQPFLPAVKTAQEVISNAFKGDAASQKDTAGKASHKHSTVHKQKSPHAGEGRGYTIAKISFIGHSLGGLVQTYAVAYIQKHSPQFFDLIKPINFIALATPFLGLNHENPMYVKFALDFNLIGRTGQDLGLTWRPPTIARSGWGAIVGNLGENAHKKVMGEPQPESKPLLRILPTGPAHIAFKKFRNRTVYSNVVNDGIVPLRTSCLLFLDWQGLGRVEKARREAGLVETLVGAGWAELTGANVTSPRTGPWTPKSISDTGSPPSGAVTPISAEESREVPQPPTDAVAEDDRQSLRPVTSSDRREDQSDYERTSHTNNSNPFSGFFSLFKNGNETSKPPEPPTAKQKKIYMRSQTLQFGEANGSDSSQASQSKVTSGHELSDDASSGMSAPPKTSFFESAGDLLNPKLPSVEYLLNPEVRPRTIFHDRVYHPEDIPPPPLKKRSTSSLAHRRASAKRTMSSSSLAAESNSSLPLRQPAHQDSVASAKDYDDTSHTNPNKEPNQVIDSSNMKVEEKIARAYHRDLSWRKVLVKLEPDAHNNIVCRRMFANAFGWPVIKHLVDAHFSDSIAARSRDEDEHNTERAKATDHGPDKHGNETTDPTGPAPAMASSHVTDGEPQKPQTQASKLKDHRRTDSENREATDSVSDLPPNTSRTDGSNALPPVETWYDRGSSVSWSDRDFADSGEESDSEDVSGPIHSHKGQGHGAGKNPERSNSPLSGAYWTEKIVGKGAVEKRRSKSPPNATATKDSHEQAGQTAALTTFEAPGRTSVSSAPASDTKPSDID
ncbi:unnamed protein product [Discula destructiva]